MSRQRRVVRWLLFGSFACILFVFGLFYFSTKRVAEDIQKEEKLLLAMGVDVRPVAKADDAQLDYKQISEAIIANAKSPQPVEIILQLLEEAGKKPTVGFDEARLVAVKTPSPSDRPFNVISRWMLDLEIKAGKKHDWKTLDRLFAIEMRLRTQLLAGENDVFGTMSVTSGQPPMFILVHEDARIRKWLRGKYESYDIGTMLQAKLAGIGRRARRFNADPAFNRSQAKPLLRQMAEDQGSFQATADLAVLQEYRKIVESTLKLSPNEALASPTVTQLRTALGNLKSEPARWAGGQVRGWNGAYVLLRQKNVMLVELDIRDSIEQNKPLVPTWSKPYCVDPFTNEPLKLTVMMDGVHLTQTTPNMLDLWGHTIHFLPK